MNAAAITLIGVVGSGLISAFFVMIRMMASRFDRLEDKFDGKFEQQEDKFDGKFEQLENKFDGLIREVHALEVRLTDKFLGHLRAHGERLARIEAKLDINPPGEPASS